MKVFKLYSLLLIGTINCFYASDVIVLDELSTKNIDLQLVEVKEQSFEETVFALGRIEDIPSHQAVLSSKISGRVVKLFVYEGDVVQEGQVLALIESRQLGNPKIELKSPKSGLVLSSFIKVGEPVEPSIVLMEIVDRSKLWVCVQIPEREVSKIDIGSIARVNIPALGKELWKAELKRFGVESKGQVSTVEAIFELKKLHEKMIPGMRAEVFIITNTVDNVMSIPLSAIQGDPARRIVFVEDFNLPFAYQKVPVVLGMQNSHRIEVIKGLFPGDRVVTQGSYALSFSGGSSGMSLKEALDAAHGHEHNEDGSELSPIQKKGKQKDPLHDHHGHTEGKEVSLWLIVYAVMVTLICVFSLQLNLKRRKQEVGSAQ